MAAIGWILWGFVACLAIYWAICTRVVSQSEQSETYATVTTGVALGCAALWPLLFDMSPFHLIWLVPVAVVIPKVAFLDRFLGRTLRSPLVEVLPAFVAAVTVFIAFLTYATFHS
ncbi:MAG: hypothetical protein KC466_06995 [Myxococcales bacterium]|nr:hypothetical protein [Myxococcales bacterium]